MQFIHAVGRIKTVGLEGMSFEISSQALHSSSRPICPTAALIPTRVAKPSKVNVGAIKFQELVWYRQTLPTYTHCSGSVAFATDIKANDTKISDDVNFGSKCY